MQTINDSPIAPFIKNNLRYLGVNFIGVRIHNFIHYITGNSYLYLQDGQYVSAYLGFTKNCES